jgi:hypothetical protein
VRIVASMPFSTMPMLVVSCSRNDRCDAVNVPSEASSITAFTSPSNRTGRMITLRGGACTRPEPTGTVADGRSFSTMRRFSAAHWPSSPSPKRKVSGWPLRPSSANAATSFKTGSSPPST